MTLPKIGVLNISDRASAGIYSDEPGQACVALLREWLTTAFDLDYKIIPDDQGVISTELIRMADVSGCALIVTTGGTGPAPRDVTPEATRAVIEKELPGFGEVMRIQSFARVPTAILSRATAGTRGRSLVVNLPGNPRAIGECLPLLIPAIREALRHLRGES